MNFPLFQTSLKSENTINMDSIFQTADDQYKEIVKVIKEGDGVNETPFQKKYSTVINVISGVIFLLVWLVILSIGLKRLMDFFSPDLLSKIAKSLGGALAKLLVYAFAALASLFFFTGRWLLTIKRFFERLKLITLIGLSNLLIASIHLVMNYGDDKRFFSLIADFLRDLFSI
jgi:hypothetical protein